jgi:hypothetical protein
MVAVGGHEAQVQNIKGTSNFLSLLIFSRLYRIRFIPRNRVSLNRKEKISKKRENQKPS